MRKEWRLLLSLVYAVTGFVILALHTPWWVWVSVGLILDAPVLLMLRIYDRRNP